MGFTQFFILDIIMEDLYTPTEEEEEGENQTVNYDLITRKVFDEPLDVFTEVYSKVGKGYLINIKIKCF